MTQISHSIYAAHTPHTDRHTHPTCVLWSLCAGCREAFFEMFYMCRTRLLCLPLLYFPDTHRHFCTHKDKDKGRDIITCKHKRVWWHPYAIPSHLKSHLCLSLSWSRSAYNANYMKLSFFSLKLRDKALVRTASPNRNGKSATESSCAQISSCTFAIKL